MSKRRPPTIRFERLTADLGGIASQLASVHFSNFYAQNAWSPRLNAYHCRQSIEICIDLAGVSKEHIDLTVQGTRLTIRGERTNPEPPEIDASCCQRILAMEIENGPFERLLELPEAVDPAGIKARQENGLLWIHLPLRTEED
ncbi:hypothetical protein BH23VER1_BH23VER1_36370 [soil metagenome]